MTADFTGEQRMIQTLVRQFSKDVVSVKAAERELSATEPGSFLLISLKR